MAAKPFPRIYRASKEAWIGRFVLPVAFLILFLITAMNMLELNPVLGGLGLLLVLVWSAFDYLLPMLRNWIRIEEYSLEGYFNGQRFTLTWKEVLAAWMIDRNWRKFLCLGTRDGTAIIPLRFFNDQEIWKDVQSCVSGEALAADAMQRLPDFREWAATREAIVAEGDTSYRVVDHWLVQAFGWSSIAFWIATTIQALENGQPFLIPIYLLLAIIAAGVVLNWGVTEFDNDGITRRTVMGVWSIRWDELRWMEMDMMGTTLVFIGEDRQMVIYGPSLWIGPDRRNVLSLLHAQAEHRKVELRRSLWAFFRWSRNTRVKKK